MVMFLTDHYSIKDVLPFPFMKAHVNQGKEKELAAEVVGVPPTAEEGIGKLTLDDSSANMLQLTNESPWLQADGPCNSRAR